MPANVETMLDNENTNHPTVDNKSDRRTIYRRSSFEHINSCCRLYQDLVNGDRKLEHEELFGITTNLIHIESGSSKFLEILRNQSFHSKKLDKWKHDISYMRQRKYKPSSCDLFCPYTESCEKDKGKQAKGW